jgi:hypothetical protein
MQNATSVRLAFPWADDLLARVAGLAQALAMLHFAFAKHR